MRVTAHWRHYLAIHQTHVCIIDWRDTSVMCGLIIITHYKFHVHQCQAQIEF